MSGPRAIPRLGGAALLVALALVLVPALASACPVCGAGEKDRSNLAFLISTIFLSLMPLAAVGAGVWWLRSRARAVAREEITGEGLSAESTG